MKLTADQKKDLRQFKAAELQLGGYFYVKDPVTDDFQLANVTEYEMRWHPTATRMKTTMLSKENRLFVRINKPWAPFNA
jgi:hypothetical protein